MYCDYSNASILNMAGSLVLVFRYWKCPVIHNCCPKIFILIQKIKVTPPLETELHLIMPI